MIGGFEATILHCKAILGWENLGLCDEFCYVSCPRCRKFAQTDHINIKSIEYKLHIATLEFVIIIRRDQYTFHMILTDDCFRSIF